MLPSLFISHGAPTLTLTDTPAREFLTGLGTTLPARPKGILVVSAHWETDAPTVNDVAVNQTIHDFQGFPAELYRLRYPAPGSKPLAGDVAAMLEANGFKVGIDRQRGLDHGAWVPLRLSFPDADIPVVQLSVQSGEDAAYHFRLGLALAPLRRCGVLVIGSGGFTHDLASFRAYIDALDAPTPDWVTAFADWMDLALVQDRREDLLDYRRLAPGAVRNHRTEEHLLPLFVAMGAGGSGRTQRLHSSATYGVLRMDAYSFGNEA